MDFSNRNYEKKTLHSTKIFMFSFVLNEKVNDFNLQFLFK